MKIVNLVTMNIFDLPDKEAENMIESAQDIFAKVTKNNKVLKKKKQSESKNTVLNKILDD